MPELKENSTVKTHTRKVRAAGSSLGRLSDWLNKIQPEGASTINMECRANEIINYVDAMILDKVDSQQRSTR